MADKGDVLGEKRPAEDSLEFPRAIKKSNTNTQLVVAPKQRIYRLRPRSKNQENKENKENKENIQQAPQKLTARQQQVTPVLKDKSESNQKIAKSPVPDVDSGCNPFYVPQYVQNMFSVYKELEIKYCPNSEYMKQQSYLSPGFRAILVDWLVDVHFHFKMMPETIYLTVNIIDRFLSVCQIGKEFLQLVGISALLIASKYEEIWAPNLSHLLEISDNLYTKKQVLKMEKKILEKLDYEVTLPTQYHFLLRYLKVAGILTKKETAHLAFYLIELSMLEYKMIKFKPSLVSAAAVYVAMKTMKFEDCYPYNLRKHCDYSLEDLKECVVQLVKLQKKYSNKAECPKLSAVVKKYQNQKLMQVSDIAVCKELEENLQKGVM